MYANVNIQMYIYIYTYTYTCAYTFAFTYTIYTYTRIHIHIHMYKLGPEPYTNDHRGNEQETAEDGIGSQVQTISIRFLGFCQEEIEVN